MSTFIVNKSIIASQFFINKPSKIFSSYFYVYDGKLNHEFIPLALGGDSVIPGSLIEFVGDDPKAFISHCCYCFHDVKFDHISYEDNEPHTLCMFFNAKTPFITDKNNNIPDGTVIFPNPVASKELTFNPISVSQRKDKFSIFVPKFFDRNDLDNFLLESESHVIKSFDHVVPWVFYYMFEFVFENGLQSLVPCPLQFSGKIYPGKVISDLNLLSQEESETLSEEEIHSLFQERLEKIGFTKSTQWLATNAEKYTQVYSDTSSEIYIVRTKGKTPRYFLLYTKESRSPEQMIKVMQYDTSGFDYCATDVEKLKNLPEIQEMFSEFQKYIDQTLDE